MKANGQWLSVLGKLTAHSPVRVIMARGKRRRLERPPGGASPACAACGSIAGSRVTDSRQAGETIRRRRECLACGERFTTYEQTHVPQALDWSI